MEALKLNYRQAVPQTVFSESFLNSYDGKPLHIATWLPENGPRAIILLVHGLGDHVMRFNHWGSLFNSEHVGVIGIDLRGHGKSPGRRGNATYENLLNDVNTLVNYSFKKYPNLPKLLYGHSLGGNVVLNYVIKNKPSLSGVIVTSPWIKTVKRWPTTKLFFAKWLNKLIPSYAIENNIHSSDISGDWAIVRAYRNDPLVHKRISVRLFFEATRAGEFIRSNKHKINSPLLIMHGTSDRITSSHATEQFAKYTSRNTQLKLWKGAYHELHNETQKDEIFDYIIQWVNNLQDLENK